MVERLRGEDAWRYDTRCILCKRNIAPEETVYRVGMHVFHEKCLEWLLGQPRERFEEILRHLPLDTHEELRRLYEEKHSLREAMEEGGERKGEHGSGSGGDPPERREATREVRRMLWRLAWRIVDEALGAAGARRAGELRVDGIAPERWAAFAPTLVALLNRYVEGAGIRVEPRRDEQGNIREADIYMGGEYWGTWRFYEPKAGSTRNWAHRIYNLLKAAYEAGYEVLAPVGGSSGGSSHSSHSSQDMRVLEALKRAAEEAKVIIG